MAGKLGLDLLVVEPVRSDQRPIDRMSLFPSELENFSAEGIMTDSRHDSEGRGLASAGGAVRTPSPGGFCRTTRAVLQLEDLVHDLGSGGDHRAQFTAVDDFGSA